MQALTSVFFSIGILLGFFLPGILLNRILGKPNSIATSFIISWTILFQVIFLLGLAGVRLNILSVSLTIVALNAILYAYCLHKKINVRMEPLESNFSLRPKDLWWLSPVLLSILLMFLKTSLFQLPHGDQDFRWFLLPRQMLANQTFSFYPPITDLDYEKYFFTDSFPPMVSFGYFWVFALYGASHDFLVFIPVSLQFVFLLAFGYKLAKRIYGTDEHGLFAMMLLSSSTLLFYSVVICQETGLTALSTLALTYYLCKSDAKWQDACLASFATALGALSREYGGVLVVCGAMVIICRGQNMRLLAYYLFFCAILIAPWYVRVFTLTGNPFYSNPFAKLPVNPVHAGILNGYKEIIGFEKYMTSKIIVPLFCGIFSVAPLALLLGIPSFFLKPRNLFMPLICIIFASLWLYSIWIPAGLFHSMRILSPAISILCVSGIKTFHITATGNRLRMNIGLILLFIVSTMTFIQNIFVPLNPLNIRGRDFLLAASIVADPVNLEEETVETLVKLPENSIILSDGALQHAYAARNKEKLKNIRIIPVWGPQVRFLFDEKMDFQKSSEILRKKNIRYVMIGRKGNLNMNYLQKFDFFRQFHVRSKTVVEDRLYELPDPQAGF